MGLISMDDIKGTELKSAETPEQALANLAEKCLQGKDLRGLLNLMRDKNYNKSVRESVFANIVPRMDSHSLIYMTGIMKKGIPSRLLRQAREVSRERNPFLSDGEYQKLGGKTMRALRSIGTALHLVKSKPHTEKGKP
jgi:hypothetical protein